MSFLARIARQARAEAGGFTAARPKGLVPGMAEPTPVGVQSIAAEPTVPPSPQPPPGADPGLRRSAEPPVGSPPPAPALPASSRPATSPMAPPETNEQPLKHEPPKDTGTRGPERSERRRVSGADGQVPSAPDEAAHPGNPPTGHGLAREPVARAVDPAREASAAGKPGIAGDRSATVGDAGLPAKGPDPYRAPPPAPRSDTAEPTPGADMPVDEPFSNIAAPMDQGSAMTASPDAHSSVSAAPEGAHRPTRSAVMREPVVDDVAGAAARPTVRPAPTENGSARQPATPAPADKPPLLHIDQIDVVVTDPAPQMPTAPSRARLAAVSASRRYLRRL